MRRPLLPLLVFLISACNGLDNPFGSSDSGDGSGTQGSESSGSNNAPKDIIVDSSGKVIGTLETRNADLSKDFTVRMEDGTRVVLNNASSTIVLAEGTPAKIAFSNSACSESGLDGAIVQTQTKGAFPLTINGQSRLYKAGAEVQGTIESFLVRAVPSLPELVCEERPPSADPLTLKGYRLVPYTPPFDYPFNIPFQKKSP